MNHLKHPILKRDHARLTKLHGDLVILRSGLRTDLEFSEKQHKEHPKSAQAILIHEEAVRRFE